MLNLVVVLPLELERVLRAATIAYLKAYGNAHQLLVVLLLLAAQSLVMKTAAFKIDLFDREASASL
jgi:hypothetical protein